MFKIFNDNYYVDIDEIEKYINITSPSGGTEMHINVVKYEAVKTMLEVLMTEDEEVDETLGLKGANGLTIPFKLAFNSLLNKKLLNKY
jgi:DNA-binding ferritin-like protein (Dps family)